MWINFSKTWFIQGVLYSYIFKIFLFFLYVATSDKKGPDAVLPIFHCDVVKFTTSHNKNKHLLTGQMHINEPIKSW
jgi:hypothetical protein